LAEDVTAEMFVRCFGAVRPAGLCLGAHSCAEIPQGRGGQFHSRNRSVGVVELELIKKLSE